METKPKINDERIKIFLKLTTPKVKDKPYYQISIDKKSFLLSNNPKLINYQQIIDNERKKVKNSENIITRLKSELEYVKKNINESKIIKEEILIQKKKITELNGN